MKTILIAFVLLIFSLNGFSQQSFITLSKPSYLQGDTISFNCKVNKYISDSIHFATLYVFIENPDTRQNWVYRYPIIDGICDASLIADSSLHNGKYAFAFRVRKSFFSINGMSENGDNMELNYSMQTKNNDGIINTFRTDANGNFSVRGLLFEDSCLFAFYPTKPISGDPLIISITTPLDSAFTPEYSYTQVITLGKSEVLTETDRNYQVDANNILIGRTGLPDVIVKTTVKKKKIDLFNEEFSTGMFSSANARIFDGLEDNRIAQSGDILDFLKTRVAGLNISNRNGTIRLLWRGPSDFRNGSNVDVFIDEMQVSPVTQNMITPSEVAMIKVYPPPAYLSAGGSRGAIAIYTKRGQFQPDVPNKNKFKVFGYSPIETVWK